MLETEEWRPLEKSNGYEVSNHGRVRGKHGIMKPMAEGGYLTIRIRIGKRSISFLIHRLVYHVFIGPIPVRMWINHIDGDKRNNHPDNLEAMTPHANALHAKGYLWYRAMTDYSRPTTEMPIETRTYLSGAGRRPGLWLRSRGQTWCTTINGKQLGLSRDLDDAYAQYCKLVPRSIRQPKPARR